MEELTRVQTSKLVGGRIICEILARRIRIANQKGKIARLERLVKRYLVSGCAMQ